MQCSTHYIHRQVYENIIYKLHLRTKWEWTRCYIQDGWTVSETGIVTHHVSNLMWWTPRKTSHCGEQNGVCRGIHYFSYFCPNHQIWAKWDWSSECPKSVWNTSEKNITNFHIKMPFQKPRKIARYCIDILSYWCMQTKSIWFRTASILPMDRFWAISSTYIVHIQYFTVCDTLHNKYLGC